mmetsp:Transcript_44012/g.70621  ORF Transcript_44012/g.70621 Transcript_44012/m.70621 type:complete len:222 (-) Transcript_44012:315-980(-)
MLSCTVENLSSACLASSSTLDNASATASRVCATALSGRTGCGTPSSCSHCAASLLCAATAAEISAAASEAATCSPHAAAFALSLQPNCNAGLHGVAVRAAASFESAVLPAAAAGVCCSAVCRAACSAARVVLCAACCGNNLLLVYICGAAAFATAPGRDSAAEEADTTWDVDFDGGSGTHTRTYPPLFTSPILSKKLPFSVSCFAPLTACREPSGILATLL